MIYLLLVLALGLFLLWQAGLQRRRRVPAGWITRWWIPPLLESDAFTRKKLSVPVLSRFGLPGSFLAEFLRMNGGMILLPGLVYLRGMRTHNAVVATLVIVRLLAVPFATAHAAKNHVDWWLPRGAGGTVGARIGSDFG